MLPQKLDAVKYYLNLHLAKGFIKASSTFNSFPVFFVKKLGRKIRFYVNYQKLKAITKKNYFLILLIEETLAQLEGAKCFTKIDIYHAFYQIKIFEDSKKLTTFLIRFDAFKYLIILFGLYNKSGFWQYFINNTLFNFLYCFIQIYLDDILIYSKTLKDHCLYVC